MRLVAELRHIGRRQSSHAGPRPEDTGKGPRQHWPTATVLLGEAAVRKALAATMRVDFHEPPLTDVLDYLKDRFEFEIQVDTSALSDARIGSSVPVTLQASGLTLRTALQRILSPLNMTAATRPYFPVNPPRQTCMTTWLRPAKSVHARKKRTARPIETIPFNPLVRSR